MTGMPAAVERQSARTPQRLNKLSEIRVRKAIQQCAREVAEKAGPLTPAQLVLLKVVFSHQSGGG